MPIQSPGWLLQGQLVLGVGIQLLGGLLLEIMNPAKTLPISRCLMELIRKGWLSLMG